ncbi:helix-turn-helix transcriptional regulator [Rhodococcus erythropolis]|uniref:helix-turn-helix transcriptional regulator n=1 Tax=Rhodococcus erythropolis TaxID=1833 RepID=UPI003788C2C3
MKKRRIELGMTRGDLARAAGLSVTAIADWESRRRTPQVDSLAQVAAALKCEIGVFVEMRPGDRSLADLRILAGLTQPQLGKLVGISTTVISSLERAESGLSNDRAAALAKALNVDVETIKAGYAKARNRAPGERP